MSPSTFIGTKSQLANRSLDQIVDQFKDVKVGNNDKTFRVYEDPKNVNQGEKKYITKLHTGFSIFGKGKDVRDARRKEGVEVIKTALANQLKCSPRQAEILMTKVGVVDRVSLGQIRQLKLEVLDIDRQRGEQAPAKLKGVCDKLLNKEKITPGDLPARQFVATEFPKTQFAQDLMKEAREGTGSTEMKKLDDLIELAESDNFESLLGKDSNKPDDWKDAQGGGFVNDFKKVLVKLKRQAGAAAMETEFNKLEIPKFKPDDSLKSKVGKTSVSITELLEHGTFDRTKSGATGAMIVTGDEVSGGEVFLKCEDKAEAQAMEDISLSFDVVSEKLAEKGLRLPVDGMTVSRLEVTKEECEEIRKKVEPNLKKNDDLKGNNTVNEKLTGLSKGNYSLMKLDKVEGSIDFHKMPIMDRLNLCRTMELPQSVGSALILTRLFGLDDHLVLNVNGMQGRNNNSNLSNFMFNPTTGRLTFIDYSKCPDGRSDQKSGFANKNILAGFGEILRIANHVKDQPAQLGEFYAIETGVPHGLDGVRSTFLGAGGEGGLFGSGDVEALKLLSADVQNRFLLNVLLGAIDTLTLVAKNPEAFAESKMVENPQELMQEIGKLVGDLSSLRSNLAVQLDKYPI